MKIEVLDLNDPKLKELLETQEAEKNQGSFQKAVEALDSLRDYVTNHNLYLTSYSKPKRE
jgi:hypothetical protein